MTLIDAPTDITIFLVDDHPMVRAGLVGMIQGERGMKLVGEAGDGRDAVRLIPDCKPDVVLVDLIMPHLDGIGVIEALHPILPDTRFVVLSSMLDPDAVRRAVQAGARGYLLKTASAQELINMILQVKAGRRVLGPEVTDAMIANEQRDVPGADLTQRERQILALMVRGMSNQEIADQMSIAVPTVKFHVTNVLSKLQVDSRTEAVVLAIKHKLVPGD
ncbi:MAG TPA: response regulator transcription factor [Aquabacterium sp.]|uniref:response regulator transcription factor n=1 Tax=Aquabacterium sp. TaxID=1872578 RepID=UPI002E322326|nr:response regulator transcription factor [Aquabacterium sp.]HEX5355246.1 response regulator transcription factor [Aquabacterium sp.]